MRRVQERVKSSRLARTTQTQPLAKCAQPPICDVALSTIQNSTSCSLTESNRLPVIPAVSSHKMAALIKEQFHNALHFIFPQNCFEELLVNFNFLHEKCVPLVASRCIGLAITAGAMFLFVPQILKIQQARSAEGISLTAMLLGLLPAVAMCAYSYESNFVFSQYGDSVFVVIQMAIIVCQILYYSEYSAYAFAFGSGFWALSLAILYHWIPFSVILGLQTSGIFFMIVSKGIQINTNYQAQSTGQLAFITVLLQFGGCLARIFTSLTETDDKLVLATFIAATVMNGIIFLQFFLYKNKAKKVKKAQ
uniref:Mannose-P-dolichol utilization defect 1 protein homolog n=1 Tax=Panagrellus redivivus TaxID=6233 RepID=A0A7E4VUX1_PANRE